MGKSHQVGWVVLRGKQYYSYFRRRVLRSYLKSIFDEAIEQEFLVRDPTRKLKIPKNLRPKDKRVLMVGAAGFEPTTSTV
jgi:hypothetical protein